MGVAWECGQWKIVKCLLFPHSIITQATPREPHGEPEVFVVSLSVVSQTDNFPSEVDTDAGTAYIEPQGVVQLARGDYSGVEGQEVGFHE